MKKIKGLIAMILIPLTFFSLSACKSGGGEPAYEQITIEAAKAIIDSGVDCIILDTRTSEEFLEGHIKNAVNLDYVDVNAKAEAMLPDKSALILVYCRSGRRSKIAAQSLCELGYTNVKEFGGIIDWPYETVK